MAGLLAVGWSGKAGTGESADAVEKRLRELERITNVLTEQFATDTDTLVAIAHRLERLEVKYSMVPGTEDTETLKLLVSLRGMAQANHDAITQMHKIIGQNIKVLEQGGQVDQELSNDIDANAAAIKRVERCRCSDSAGQV